MTTKGRKLAKPNRGVWNILLDEKHQDIVPREFPNFKPQDATGSYLASKLNRKLLVDHVRVPPSDVARDSICVDLVQSRRRLEIAEERLRKGREEANRRDPRKQILELEETQKSLRARFEQFNDFIRENHEKRDRALKKLEDDRRMKIVKENQITKMRNKLETLIDAKALMEQKIAQHKIFEHFLMDTVKVGTLQFKNIGDVLLRYDALLHSKQFLGMKHDETLVKLETARGDLAKLIEDKTLILMGLCNKILGLRSRHKHARENSLMWENLVGKIQSAAASTKGGINHVKEACYSIYKNMCTRKNIPADIRRGDFENQLAFIKRTMMQLNELTANAQKDMSNEINSMKVETSVNKEISITSKQIQKSVEK